jgi:hypothetical protein
LFSICERKVSAFGLLCEIMMSGFGFMCFTPYFFGLSVNSLTSR